MNDVLQETAHVLKEMMSFSMEFIYFCEAPCVF